MRPKRRLRPVSMIVRLRDTAWELNLETCRYALVRLQVDGEVDSMGQLAAKAGCSRSTASRFLAGRSPSLKTILAILGALKLRFDDVAKPLDQSV